MAHQADGDQTMFQIAQLLLGDGQQAHRLQVQGWDGQDPQHKPQKDARIMAPGERPGPPSPWLLDPARWGRGR